MGTSTSTETRSAVKLTPTQNQQLAYEEKLTEEHKRRYEEEERVVSKRYKMERQRTISNYIQLLNERPHIAMHIRMPANLQLANNVDGTLPPVGPGQPFKQLKYSADESDDDEESDQGQEP